MVEKYTVCSLNPNFLSKGPEKIAIIPNCLEKALWLVMDNEILAEN